MIRELPKIQMGGTTPFKYISKEMKNSNTSCGNRCHQFYPTFFINDLQK